MRVVLTHNLRVTADPSEARYAPPETVTSLVKSLERLGHDVVPVEVSGPVADTLARLQDSGADLVYNIAEGWPGGPGQEFWPGMFEHVGLPYTASSTAALILAIDKNLTKLVLRAHGVRTPAWQFVRDVADYNPELTGFPVIVKPNYEGTSLGITQDSVVDQPSTARARIKVLLAQYPAGVIVEQYIAGRDVTADYLEGVANEYDGVLEPTETVLKSASQGDSHTILEYGYKNLRYRAVTEAPIEFELRTPPAMPAGIIDEMRRTAATCVKALGVRDIATVDFRVDGDVPYVLEVNTLPRLDPELRSHRSGQFVDVRPEDSVVAAVLSSAARRYGLNIDRV